jgi:tetratricopeptide (TPR) repeat protein
VTIDLEGKRAAWKMIEALAGLDRVDSIIVSDAAAPFLERRFELMLPAPGETSTVPFRRLTRREPTGFGLGGRPLSRFVGRDGELQLVTDRVADAARGHGQVIGIVGEPGVGKSRFVYELIQIGAMHDWRVLSCGGVSHGTTTPLLPIGELLRRYFAIEDANATESISAKVSETLGSRHEALRSLLTPLLSLLDIAVDDPAWSNLDPAQQRRRIQDAVKELLRNESQIQPLMVIVEDLQWIDPATQALLDGLIESLPTVRLVLLVSYRPEYQHRWGSKSYYNQLRLGALRPENTGELLQALVGDDPGLEPLTRQLVKRGNPFFIEESIRTLVETGALSGTPGACQLSRPIEAIEIPATVQLILAARIERLAAADKQLLQTASVIGKNVPFALLHAVTEDGEEDVQRGLSHLSAAEFLYETRLLPDAEYTFKHALTHDVTYGTVLEDRRTELHRRIVAAIERVYPDRLNEHVEWLGYHAVRGHVWEQAVAYLRQAGGKAVNRAAYREAVTCFEQALAALEHLPESADTLKCAVDLRLDLKVALFPLGEFERIFHYLRGAERSAMLLDDQRPLCRLYTDLCHSIGLAGHPGEAIVFGQKSCAIAESLGDVSLQVVAKTYLGGAYLRTGDYRRAESLLVQMLESLEDSEGLILSGFPAATARGYLTMIFTDWGEFEQAFTNGREGVLLAEQRNHPVGLANICWLLAYVHLERRELEDTVSLFERGLAVSREWNLSNFAVFHSIGLGYAYALSGRAAEGIPLMERAVSAYVVMGQRFSHAIAATYLGEAYLLADRLEDALEFAGRALTIAREWGLRCWEAKSLKLLGDVTARGDSTEPAERHYRDALALSDELGMRPLIAHCHAGLGRLFERAGKHEEAREQRTTATAMYREMGMTLWLEDTTT